MKKISLLLTGLLIYGFMFSQERSLEGKITGEGSQAGLTGAHINIYNATGDIVIYQGISDRNGLFSNTGIIKSDS